MLAAGTALVSAPVGAGLVALVWQFPVMIAGRSGGDVGAAIAAAITMVMFMTVFSIFAGALGVAAAGAGVGYLVRRRPMWAALIGGVVVGIVAAVTVSGVDAILVGPGA